MAMNNQAENPRAIALQWFGILGGPLAWLLQFIVNYALVRRACIAHSTTALHVVSALFLLVVIAAGIVSLLGFLKARQQFTSEDEAAARPHFLALLGLLTSSLYTLGIIMQVIASFVWSPCLR
jgi:hypothetical protein